MSSKLLTLLLLLLPLQLAAQTLPERQPQDAFHPGQLWLDTDGRPINAHGGGLLLHQGRYYWYGEHKAPGTCSALVGVTCYSSADLVNWHSEGVAFAVNDTVGSPTERGCVLERPKVIYCPLTGKFVMYFHLELKGQGYNAAQAGVAVSDTPTGPFRFVRAGRVCPGEWPLNLTKEQRRAAQKALASAQKPKAWSQEWLRQVGDGLITARDLQGGQMCRDMTLYVDSDGHAYHIYSSEDNLTLQIAELSPDFLHHTGRYVRLDPAGHNEAPALCRRGGKYYMITSGCTGWAPNEARLLVADNILGPWTRLPNPCRSDKPERPVQKTFLGQSTYILPAPQGSACEFIFMADEWRPQNPIDSRYLWLPIDWDPQTALPTISWHDEWRLR